MNELHPGDLVHPTRDFVDIKRTEIVLVVSKATNLGYFMYNCFVPRLGRMQIFYIDNMELA